MRSAATKYANVKFVAQGAMTERHIFALLAYEDEPGSKAKFDRQFGNGAAERVLAEVKRVPEAVKVSVDLSVINAKLAELETKVSGLVEDERLDDLEENIGAESKALQGRIEALEQKPAPVIPDAGPQIDAVSAALAARIDGIAAALKTVKEQIEARLAEMEKRPVAVAQAVAPVEKRPMTIRVTQRDVNDNIIAVEVI